MLFRETLSAQSSSQDPSAPSTPRLAVQHTLPLTDLSVHGHVTPLCFRPFSYQFLEWKTAEVNCSRRIEATLQEKHGTNKQEGAVRAVHEEGRCRFIVVEKKEG